ncbi:uncharacterized protein LOC110024100 isoform X2 [Phalaenopsis equestris]|uniref:uncharacterized protein LOC110024100 isoform X2 n=1 Tax=Phalaenopsis equestris TaxID=78828 RepID=UPI0009E396A9|nr:uncharacterized protein LOC110024100 isoform X2 [Phalaenopsis equestris]
MLRFFISRAAGRQGPLCTLRHQRWMHERNKKAMGFVAKGWSALQEVDRVIDYADLNDPRLIPLLRTAKDNFELALEVDNMNTHARYWLSRMHFKYHVPGACKLIGVSLLVEAANMGDADAQYELGCRLRVDNKYVKSDQQAFYYIEEAVEQLHPGALYLLGAVYLTGDCVKRDVASAMWCFHRASEKENKCSFEANKQIGRENESRNHRRRRKSGKSSQVFLLLNVWRRATRLKNGKKKKRKNERLS